jgi:hypothetical protein
MATSRNHAMTTRRAREGLSGTDFTNETGTLAGGLQVCKTLTPGSNPGGASKKLRA